MEVRWYKRQEAVSDTSVSVLTTQGFRGVYTEQEFLINTTLLLLQINCLQTPSYWTIGALEQISSVHFSHSVLSDSLQTHGGQHTRLPCPSQLLKPTQTHVHWVGDEIQPSHPLSSPSPPTFNLSQNQGLFQWISFSHMVGKGLELQLQHQSF